MPISSIRRDSTLLVSIILGFAVASSFLIPGSVRAAEPTGAMGGSGNDIIVPDQYGPSASGFSTSSVDPYSLIPFPDLSRMYTLGTDVYEVWECPDYGTVPTTASAFVVDAETMMTSHFSWLSDGLYDPDFIVGGAVPVGVDCATYARANATGSANAALFLRNTTGGYAGPGYACTTCPTTYPLNRREGYIGVVGSAKWTVMAHEMGHMLSWPHSFTGLSGSEYDNAIDLMSGNFGSWGFSYGTYPSPFATVGLNRYAAGWIDTSDVFVWDGNDTTIDISSIGGTGVQMVVIDTGTQFYTLDTRTSSAADPFSSPWDGVEVYRVDPCGSCWGLNTSIAPEPPVPFDWRDTVAYTAPLDHVKQPGDTFSLGTAIVSVVSRTGDSFTISIDGPTVAPHRFDDVLPTHAFFGDIEWLASEGITLGCNPPDNTMFCPDGSVTRGQMAALLVRALSLPATPTDYFTDDDGTTFEGDINRLAEAGITRGCNPPTSNLYCPSGDVTRAQMAAFLVRAFGYTAGGGADLFVDDDTSIFEADIDRLGTAGITLGCNPPTNDHYCPDSFVTRAQMAAFLHRALG